MIVVTESGQSGEMTNISRPHDLHYRNCLAVPLILSKNNMKKLTMAATLIGLAPLAVMAHPGHGETEGWSITHYFVEPEHAIYTYPLLILAGFCFVLVYRARKARKDA
jgi:hypothetical protein